jgi:hypothetical protein
VTRDRTRACDAAAGRGGRAVRAWPRQSWDGQQACSGAQSRWPSAMGLRHRGTASRTCKPLLTRWCLRVCSRPGTSTSTKQQMSAAAAVLLHLLASTATSTAGGGGLRPIALRVNNMAPSTSSAGTTNPLRLHVVEHGRAPDFSWQLKQVDSSSAGRGEMQTAFELQASNDPTFAAPFCDTGHVVSNRSLYLQPCNITMVKPGSLIYWRVRAAGTTGRFSVWVPGPTVLRGLGAADFAGQFVAASQHTANTTTAPVRLRATVVLPAASGSGHRLVKATAYGAHAVASHTHLARG